MWQPDPGWRALPAGMGSSTVGVWAASRDGHDCVVKRLAVPTPDDAFELTRPHHYAYWHREADAALAPATGPGLVAPETVAVEEDDEGVTIWSAFVERGDVPALFAARALGRFAGSAFEQAPWLCRHQLADRMARVEERGGWATLARTTVADLADALWARRARLLGELRSLPQGAVHGDPTPQNLLARHGDEVVAIDWATLGTGALGGDLGYFSLSCREDVDVLMEAYLAGARETGLPVERADAVRAAQIVSVYTAMSRADWALARVAGGEGALAAKYRHPSVSPYLRGLQRQFPQIEALLG